MKLIVGLGNPGIDYVNTRHNAGFMAVQRIAERIMATEAKDKFHAKVIEGQLADEKIMLMQPMTFMNRSGLAVGEAARFYKLAVDQILILVDDMAIPFGMIRLRTGGSAGGHNGLSSINQDLGSQKYPRVRIGVGAPIINGRRVSFTDHVLGRFTESERVGISAVLDKTADAVEHWIRHGIDQAMTVFNEKVDQKTDPKPDNN